MRVSRPGIVPTPCFYRIHLYADLKSKIADTKLYLATEYREVLGSRLKRLFAGADTDMATSVVEQRRIAQRKITFIRATLYPIDFLCGVRIRDISATGLKGEAEFHLEAGQNLHITFDEQTYHAGVVKWARDWEFGLELANALRIFNGQTPLTDHGNREGHHPRAARIKINASAQFVTGRPPRPAIIRNLSDFGMLLDTGLGLKPGQDLIVRVGDVPPIYGRVQWSENGKIGFKAQHPICILTTTS